MESERILESIIENFFRDDEKNQIYISLSESLFPAVKKYSSNGIMVIDLQEDFSPLKPFLQILKSLKLSRSDLEKSVYSLQLDTFDSWLNGDSLKKRKDIFIREELNYEKRRIREAIISLLKRHFTGDCKCIILNSQFLSEEALEILKILDKELHCGKMIFCFNSIRLEQYSDFMRAYIHALINCPDYYSITTAADFDENAILPKPRLSLDYQTLFSTLTVYNAFLALSEGNALVRQIDEASLLRKFSTQEQRSIYIEMGKLCFYRDELDLATYYFSNVIETEVGDMNEATALYYLAFLAYLKGMNPAANKYLAKIKLVLVDKTNSPEYALTLMLEYIIAARINANYPLQKYELALDLLEQTGLLNNRIFTSITIPWNILYEKQLRAKMFLRVQEALHCSESLDNRFGLSSCCHWMGICLTNDGRKEESIKWYTRCLHIREEMADLLAIIKITNGFSYEYLISARYKESYNVINEFSYHLLETDDYPEIVITLGNVGRALFFARNLEQATHVFQKLLDLMYNFDLMNVSVNSFIPLYNDILTYLAIIELFSGNYTRAKMNLYNILHNGHELSPIEEISMLFLRACVHLMENELDESFEVFADMVKKFKKVGATQEHRLAFFYYEFAIQLEKNGQLEKAAKMMAEGHKIAVRNNLSYYSQRKDAVTTAEYLAAVEQFEPLNLDLNTLAARAEKERLMNLLHKRLRDSQFLNKLMSFTIDTFNEQKYRTNVIQSVFDYTMSDAVFLAEKSAETHEWEILACSMRDEVKVPSKNLWNELLNYSRDVRPESIQKQSDRDIMYINLSKFDLTAGIIIYLKKKLWLSAEEFSTLNLAMNNIQAQLVMFNQNQHLALISSTDPLSKLKNRRAFNEHLMIESELISRYEAKSQGTMCESIVFVDLDNFKYYNDNFGHEIGDLLIAQMGVILKSVFRKVDFVARYGGDEFVVCLPNTKSAEAKRSGERLFDALKKQKFFIPEIEKALGRKIDVPKNKIFGFSIGICCNLDNSEITNLEETVSKADQALYYSKHHKKGTISVWSEIKDKLDSDGETVLNDR